jgi:hypothetical protein
MNQVSDEFSRTIKRLDAVSQHELEQVQGGQSTSWYRGATVGEAVQSFVNEATARYRALKEQYG